MVDRLASAMVHGIYAGDVWQLSARSLLPSLWQLDASPGSILLGFLQARAEGHLITPREAEFLQTFKRQPLSFSLGDTLVKTSVFTFKDGLYTLVDRLVRHLMQTGKVEFKTSTAVTEITPADRQLGVHVATSDGHAPKEFTHVISALPPWQLSSIHRSAAEAAPLIPKIPTVTTMSVSLYYRQPDLHPPGFGYLIPQATPFEQNPERALGVIFDTGYAPTALDVRMMENYAEGLTEKHGTFSMRGFSWHDTSKKLNTQDHVKHTGSKFTVMLGGHWWDGWPAYPSEKEGLEMAKSVLERHLHIKEQPEVWQVQLNKDCIPQYTVGHDERLQTAHNNIWREYRGRLRVAGNWMWGVGVNDGLRSAWEVTESLRKGRDGTGLEHVGTPDSVRIKTILKDEEEE